MRHAMVGAAAATSLLLTLAGSAAAQSTPPKAPPPAEEKKPAPAPAPAKAPEKAPAPAGSSMMEWERLTGDWGGQRTKLMDKGIDINARLTDDFTRVQQGGADSYSSASRYWIDANVTFDLDKLFKIGSGGKIFVSYWQFGGENGSKDFGSINDISSIESEFRQEVGELYYTNMFVKNTLDTRIGKMDTTERFNHSDYAGDFMNEAATIPATFFPAPSPPETAFGGDLFYRGKALYAGLGLFDGSKQEGVETGHGGATHFFGDPGDLFLVLEAGFKFADGKRPIRGAFGVWKHNGDFVSIGGQTRNGATGFYALAEGMLIKSNRDDPKDMRGFYLVMRYGSQEPNTSLIDWTATAAVVKKGTFGGRKLDSYGLAWSIASVSRSDPSAIRYGSEQVLEAYYKLHITPALSLSPNLQYIANPGGIYEDAVVVGLRLVVDF